MISLAENSVERWDFGNDQITMKDPPLSGA